MTRRNFPSFTCQDGTQRERLSLAMRTGKKTAFQAHDHKLSSGLSHRQGMLIFTFVIVLPHCWYSLTTGFVNTQMACRAEENQISHVIKQFTTLLKIAISRLAVFQLFVKNSVFGMYLQSAYSFLTHNHTTHIYFIIIKVNNFFKREYDKK